MDWRLFLYCFRMTKDYKYVFGPVPSRRLGSSLGIDLLPRKTCTYDCIYCQVGKTTHHAVHRREFVPGSKIIAEIKRKLEEGLEIDYITFSGSGEPTLHSGLGQIISRVKKMTDIPVAVITNGALLWMKEVQEGLAAADVVLPTLSTATPALFQKIHRPSPGLSLDTIFRGMIEFRKNFKGKIWLEVFVVKGLNDSEEEMRKLRPMVRKIRPDKIQLNTSVRLPSKKYSASIPSSKLQRLASILGKKAELIADYSRKRPAKTRIPSQNEILGFLKRRPATAEEIANGLNVSRESAKEVLRKMRARYIISSRLWEEREVFYFKNKRLTTNP